MHTIRLRGAWEVTTPRPDTLRHGRRFGRPRTLDANERLWLVCAHVPGPADVLLNDRIAGTVSEAGSFALDITDLLLHRNEVAFVVSSGDPLGDVVLEVRTGADVGG